MDDLVQWLRAVLDAEAEEAQAVAEEFGAVWTVDEAMESVRSNTGADVLDEPGAPRGFIAEHDPARVLREIDAKRRLLAEFEREGAVPDTPEDRARPNWRGEFGYLQGLARAVHLMASVYADRPGYREEWRP